MIIQNDIRSTSALLYAALATIIRKHIYDYAIRDATCKTHSYNNIENTQTALAVIT